MGGKNFFNTHGRCMKMRHCGEIKGQTFVIDTSFQMYKYMIGIQKRKNNEHTVHNYIDTKSLTEMGLPINNDFESTITHIIAICSFVELLLDRQIFPYFVFDGKAPELKRRKLDERRKRREKAKLECDKIEDKTSDEYIKQMKQCVEIYDYQYKDVLELLNAFGLPWIQSPGEADSQCAALACYNSTKDIAGIITDDSDPLIFGGKKIVRGFSRKTNQINELNLTDILAETKDKINKIRISYNLEPVEFTDENLVDLSILYGTDYNDPVTENTNIDITELFALNDLSVEAVCNKIIFQKDNRFNNPQNFEQLKNKSNKFLAEWQMVRDYYINAKVIDPSTINTEIKKPNICKMTQLLCNKYHFKKSVTDRLFNALNDMYNMRISTMITNDSTSFSKFRSYQVKYHATNQRKRFQQEYQFT